MDAYNFKVLTTCTDCGEQCRWHGDFRHATDGDLLPICAACAEKDGPIIGKDDDNEGGKS
jgi:NAD-dependent SIR2 family protein deacetylase